MTIVTLLRLRRFTPRGRLTLLRGLVDNKGIFDKFSINNPLRLSHFLGQCAVETAFYNKMNETGSTQRYKGRGYIQLTGQHNYGFFGRKVGIDIASEPERAAEPDLSVRLSCFYWDDLHLNN